jgi:drug/metabolite transporter (DMT)-like permease
MIFWKTIHREKKSDEAIHNGETGAVSDGCPLGQHLYNRKAGGGGVFPFLYHRPAVSCGQHCPSHCGLAPAGGAGQGILDRGFWMGLTLFISYILQVGGLALDTSPGKSAFLCTTYSVMVPFIYWFITKERPKAHHLTCVFLCLLGVGILSLSGGWRMSAGDMLTLLSGVPSALRIVISAIACRKRNVLLLTTIELWVVTIFAWIFVFAGNSFPTEFPMGAVGGIAYLGLFATALCLYMQSYGLKYTEPAIGGMLLSLESVFGVVFSVIIYHEKVTFRMFVGFAVIFAAILLSQWSIKDIVKLLFPKRKS